MTRATAAPPTWPYTNRRTMADVMLLETRDELSRENKREWQRQYRARKMVARLEEASW